jgi:hypothetical protein
MLIVIFSTVHARSISLRPRAVYQFAMNIVVVYPGRITDTSQGSTYRQTFYSYGLTVDTCLRTFRLPLKFQNRRSRLNWQHPPECPLIVVNQLSTSVDNLLSSDIHWCFSNVNTPAVSTPCFIHVNHSPESDVPIYRLQLSPKNVQECLGLVDLRLSRHLKAVNYLRLEYNLQA